MFVDGKISNAGSAKQLMKEVLATKNGIMPGKETLQGISTAISPEGGKTWVESTQNHKDHKKDGPTR